MDEELKLMNEAFGKLGKSLKHMNQELENQIDTVVDASDPTVEVEEVPVIEPKVYVARLLNTNVLYGFYKQGRKFGITCAVLLNVKDHKTWMRMSDKTHTSKRCNEIYKSLIHDYAFHPIKK